MMHEPIQAKGPTMSETLMEQCRLREHINVVTLVSPPS